MTAPELSLEEPPSGTECERCGGEVRVVGFCATCFERSMQEREALVTRDLETAKARTRAWMHGRGNA